jgi:hypothetical protein
MFNAIFQIVLLVLKEVFELKREKREERKALTKEAKDAFKTKDKKLRASRLNVIVGKSKRL